MYKKLVNILIFLSIIGAGLVTSQSLAYNDELYLFFDFSGLDNGDEKAIIAVDVPLTGGKAIRYVIYEVENGGTGDDWLLYEYGFHHQPTEVNLETFDFVIVINSNSDGSNGYDDFNFRLRIFDSGAESNTAWSVFGDATEDHNRAKIWQIQEHGTGQMTTLYSGNSIAYWRRDWSTGHVDAECTFYIDEDWEDIWVYINNYYVSVGYNSNQNWLESLLNNFNFPAPYGATK